MMRAMRTTTTLAAAALLAACAGPTWTKPGATEQAFYADQSACASQAGMGTAGQSSIMLQARQQQMYAGCMRGKGWKEQ